eukprot:TRINITY_DN31911_c0_g1_i1.p1 TRINITY_DN31911_c0_g1~~TRINITY_DN31911_c0_g1_i1.p1  ORF type:complete len:103 (-),score=2.84 TRINITY_DN31911_c0_g1_i1:233-541(-)
MQARGEEDNGWSGHNHNTVYSESARAPHLRERQKQFWRLRQAHESSTGSPRQMFKSTFRLKSNFPELQNDDPNKASTSYFTLPIHHVDAPALGLDPEYPCYH